MVQTSFYGNGSSFSEIVAASTSAAAAAASFDSFDDRYLGAKAANPTVDNDGLALLVGALYWNTVANEMRAWSGTIWRALGATASAVSYVPTGTIAASDVQGALNELDSETQAALALKAPLASPTLTGVPAAPTAAVGTNTTQLATTAHVLASIGYAEGLWTPADNSGAGLAFTGVAARYQKIRNLVHISGTLTYPATANGSVAKISGLPFAVNGSGSQTGNVCYTNGTVATRFAIDSGATTAQWYTATGGTVTNAQLSTITMVFDATYQV